MSRAATAANMPAVPRLAHDALQAEGFEKMKGRGQARSDRYRLVIAHAGSVVGMPGDRCFVRRAIAQIDQVKALGKARGPGNGQACAAGREIVDRAVKGDLPVLADDAA